MVRVSEGCEGGGSAVASVAGFGCCRTGQRKRAAGRCMTPYCRRDARKGRRFCNTCRSRRYDDPLKVLFWNLKKSARKRGKEFALSWEYFLNFVIGTDYVLGRGREGSGMHIDRIDGKRGYVPGNLQVLTNVENVRKSFVDGSRGGLGA